MVSPSSYRTHPSPFESGLRSDGKRMTPQRKKVLSLFEEIGSGIHLSAEEVHTKLTSSGERVSLQTRKELFSFEGSSVFHLAEDQTPKGKDGHERKQEQPIHTRFLNRIA